MSKQDEPYQSVMPEGYSDKVWQPKPVEDPSPNAQQLLLGALLILGMLVAGAVIFFLTHGS